jgi:hypothetical protein
LRVLFEIDKTGQKKIQNLFLKSGADEVCEIFVQKYYKMDDLGDYAASTGISNRHQDYCNHRNDIDCNSIFSEKMWSQIDRNKS